MLPGNHVVRQSGPGGPMCKPKVAKHTRLYNRAGSQQHRVGQHASRACCLETMVFVNLGRGGRCANRMPPGTSSFIAGSVLNKTGLGNMPPWHAAWKPLCKSLWAGRADVQTKGGPAPPALQPGRFQTETVWAPCLPDMLHGTHAGGQSGPAGSMCNPWVANHI